MMRTIKNRNENGRPKLAATEVRKRRIEVRFATVEYYALKAKAKAAGATISEFIRTALQNSVVKERLRPEHLREILQLTGMANNLNQIARKANAAGYVEARSECSHLVVRIDGLINEIENGR